MKARFDRGLIPAFPDLGFEADLWSEGYTLVCGVDEAGRGALAGPVAAGAVILPPDPSLETSLQGVRDSKQMTPDARQAWSVRLAEVALAWAVGFASPAEIDDIGIAPATRLAMLRAVEGLALRPQYLLIDYLKLPGCPVPQKAIVKGDARSLSIASASVVAKTARDNVMCQLDGQYPGYRFSAHKGYGTAAHRQAIQSLGPCEAHRHSFTLLPAQPEADPQESTNHDQD